MERDSLIQDISPQKLAVIGNDPAKTAKAIKLLYVSDSDIPGINRKKRGKKFRYFYKGAEVTDTLVLERIWQLVIPPAWEEVWICPVENGHLQATGMDTKQRKQYLYHPAWVASRNQGKYYRMIQFARALPTIRLHLEHDLARKGLPSEKVLALVVSLMEKTNIRVGNEVYEKVYGSFGITTLKDKHIEVKGSSIRFYFNGKKGVYHDIKLKNPKLARMVQRCKEIPGKELFQYYDDEGKRQSVDSGMVNDYIRDISGEDYTSKDFRTWAGTVNTFLALRELGTAETETDKKKKIVEAVDRVAAQLGNTRAVCKKYYVHPLIFTLYEYGSIQRYYDKLDHIEKNTGLSGLTKEEKIILSILEKGS